MSVVTTGAPQRNDADRAVGRAQVRPVRALLARLRLRAWMARPVLFLLGGLVLLAVCRLLYGFTPRETFSREVVVAVLGAVVTIFGAAVIAFVALRNQLRAFEEQRILRRFEGDVWKSSSIKVGAMEIPDIAIVASCGQGRSWSDSTTVEFIPSDAPRPSNGTAVSARHAVLPALREKAAADKVILFDDDCVDIVDADQSIVVQNGARQRRLKFAYAPARYFDFVATTSRLDSPNDVSVDPEGRPLREIWGHGPSSLMEIAQLPSMAKLGSGTVVVTNDERVVLGVRGRTYIASQAEELTGRRSLHFVAEGTLPSDLGQNGRLDPAVGIARGLAEELNIGPSSRRIGRVTETVATGIYFDQQRWQPCFSYLSRVDIDWNELQTAAPIAKDSWEVEGLVSLPFDIQHRGIRSLLLGTHPDFRLASNHAAAMLWFALLHKHGYHVMRDHLLS